MAYSLLDDFEDHQEYATSFSLHTQLMVITHDPVNMTTFVRAMMKRYVSYKYTRGQNTLIVYLLDPEMEKLVFARLAAGRDGRGRLPLSEDEWEKVLGAVHTEVGHLPHSTSTPVILTTIEVRAAVREIIAPTFPRLPVIAYQELSPDMNIQPIARISLDN